MCIKLKKCAHLEQVAHAIASSSNQQSAQWENFTKACECESRAVVKSSASSVVAYGPKMVKPLHAGPKHRIWYMYSLGQYKHFSILPPKSLKSHEILRKFELRSSNVIDLVPMEIAYATSY